MKKEISKYIIEIYRSNLEGKMDDIIKFLETLKIDYLNDYKYLKIDTQNNYQDGYTEFTLFGVRDETDEEYQTRINAIDVNKKVIEERERKQLAQLKIKYES